VTPLRLARRRSGIWRAGMFRAGADYQLTCSMQCSLSWEVDPVSTPEPGELGCDAGGFIGAHRCGILRQDLQEPQTVELNCWARHQRSSGYWVDASLVTAPEPGSLALLASAFGAWGLTRRRRTRSE
jgi:hypothetical protein